MDKNKLLIIGIGFGLTGFTIPASAYLNTRSLDDINSSKKLDIDFDNNEAINNVNNKTYNPSSTTAKYVSSLKGNAYEPNNSKVNVPFADLGLSENNKVITVSFIMKWEGNDTNFFPVSIYGGTGNGSNNLWVRQGLIGFNTGNAEVYGKLDKLEEGKYYSIVAEFNYADVSKNKLYIDGVKQDLSYVHGTESRANVWDANATFSIGGYFLTDTYNIKDKSIVDEVKLYTKSLTQSEVNEVTNSHKIPELRGEVVNNKYPKLDWATEILPENVFWQVGYEENEQSNIDLVYNVNNNLGDGGQLFDNTNVYSGNYSLYTPKTRPDKGNWVLYPYTTPSVQNHIYYRGNSITFNNDDKISISYRIKTNQKADVRILADWKYEKKFIYYGVKTTADIKKGDKVIPVTDASQFKYGMRIAFDKDPNVIDETLQKNVNYATQENNTITLTAGVPYDIPAGTELYYRATHWAFEDSTKIINPSDKWQLINFNTGLSQSDYLDWSEYALNLRQGWSTYGEAYMDDLKIGYATKVRLYRDGSKVYEGYEAEFNDTTAIDKTVPDKVSLTSINTNMEMVDASKSQRKLKINFDEVKDNGTSYDYQISSVDKEEVESPKSETLTQTVTSGLKGYSYVIDKNPNTNPSNTVNLTTNSIETNITDSGVYYLHIKAIDNNGNVSETTHYKIDIPSLTAKANSNEDMIRLDWIMDDISNKTFKVYQKKPGSNEFQTISTTNFDASKQVKVLNVYPPTWKGTSIEIESTYTTWDGETISGLPKSASLKKWMEEPNEENPKGYGKGLIEVTPVTIDDFNSNPSKYLSKDSDGNYLYDVIMFGTWDSNGNNYDLNQDSLNEVKSFVDSGRGLLLGHDTLRQGTMPMFTELRGYINIETPGDKNIPSSYQNVKYSVVSKDILKKKEGLLTNYPWIIDKTQLIVPTTHTSRQWAYGDIWFEFTNIDSTIYSGYEGVIYNGVDGKGTNNFYLTTWNNTAMIQTGHSNGLATPDEQKILANTLFYLNQLSSDNYLDDNSGQDVTAPNVPQIYEHKFIGNGVVEFKFNEVVDNGSEYSYYVESETKNNDLALSNVVNETITSGLKGYSYEVDYNPDTIPDDIVDVTKAGTLNVDMTYSSRYLHIKAIDNVGNVSDTFHYKIVDNNPPKLDVYLESEDWTDEDVKIMVNAWDNDYESGIDRIVLPDGNVVKVEDGQYSINTNYIAGNGTYTFEAYDKLGNKTTKTITVDNVDKNAPNLQVYADNEEWINQPVKINISAWDYTYESGIAKVKLPNGEFLYAEKGINNLNGEYYVEENGDYEFIAYDFAGNEHKIVYSVTWIDKESPELELLLDNYNWTNGGINIRATAWDGDIAIGDITVGIDKVKLPNGEFIFAGEGEYDITTFYPVTENGTYTFEAYDKLGNKTTESITVSNIEREKPNLEVYIENGEPSQTVDILIDAWDNDFGSGINKVKLPNGNFVTPNTGEYNIHNIYTVSANGEYEFIAYDNAGNTITKSITITNIDNELPTMTITGNPTDWTGEDVTLNVVANDTFSGINYIVLPNGSIVKGNNANYTVNSNGNYIFKAVDMVGNELTQIVNVTKIDNSSPQVSYTKELSSDKMSMNLAISALDSQSGVDYVITPEGDKIYKDNFTYTVNSNGIYPFVVYDKVGKSTSVNITVTELSDSMFPPSEIDRIEYKLSGATTKDWTVYDNPFYITNEGITTITARAYDKAGNLSDETTSIVKIDKTKPNNNSILIELK